MDNFWLTPGDQRKCMRCYGTQTKDIICEDCKVELSDKFPDLEWENAYLEEVEQQRTKSDSY